MNRSGCDDYCHQQAHRINEDVSFAPFDLLTTIVTSFRPADGCRFYTLAIETACRRVLVFTGFFTNACSKSVMDSEPHTFFAPRPEIVVYGFTMREVRRKSSRLTTRFEHMKNAIHDPAQTDFTRTASLVLLRQKGFKFKPCTFTEIGCITLLS